MKKLFIVVGAALVLTLTGCTATTQQKVDPPTVAPAGETTPSPTPSETPTSDGMMHVGDGFQLTDMGEPVDAKFVIKKITIDPKCTGEWAEPAKHAHLIRLDVEGETGNVDYPVNFVWKVVAANGTTFNGMVTTEAAVSCLPLVDQLPDMIESNERVHGAIVLDVPSKHGTLILEPSFYDSGLRWDY